jgi:hypothetical protein
MSEPIVSFSQSDGQRIAQSVRFTESRSITNGAFNEGLEGPFYAEITSLVSETDDKQAKGEQRVYEGASLSFETPTSPWVFDIDNTTAQGQGDIFSDQALTVGDIVEVVPYVDSDGTATWIVRRGGGTASRTIIKTAGALTYGAILENITTQTVKQEFTEAQSFKALLPWGSTIDLPDDYVFTADLDGDNVYYTETYPQLYTTPQAPAHLS